MDRRGPATTSRRRPHQTHRRQSLALRRRAPAGALGALDPSCSRALPRAWSGRAHSWQPRPSARAHDRAALKRRIVTLAKTTYAGVNDSHLAELLAERERISVSRASVQRILRAAGLRSPRRHTRARYRARRERRPAAGMLVQLDGSPHDWFGTGLRVTLQAAVDDATGDVLAAVFREQEDAAGYFALLRTVLLAQGVPLAMYGDKHTIFRVPPRERETLAEELAPEREPTQFGRALAELGIEQIIANSPQASARKVL